MNRQIFEKNLVNNSIDSFHEMGMTDYDDVLRKAIKLIQFINEFSTRTDELDIILKKIRLNAFLAIRSLNKDERRYFHLHIRSITELIIMSIFLIKETEFITVRNQFEWLKNFCRMFQSDRCLKYEIFKGIYSKGSQVIHNGISEDETVINVFSELDNVNWIDKQQDCKNFIFLIDFFFSALAMRYPSRIRLMSLGNKKGLEFLIGKRNMLKIMNGRSITLRKGLHAKCCIFLESDDIGEINCELVRSWVQIDLNSSTFCELSDLDYCAATNTLKKFVGYDGKLLDEDISITI